MELAHSQNETPDEGDLTASYKYRWRGPLAVAVAAKLTSSPNSTVRFNVNEADVALMLAGTNKKTWVITWDSDLVGGCPENMLCTWPCESPARVLALPPPPSPPGACRAPSPAQGGGGGGGGGGIQCSGAAS